MRMVVENGCLERMLQRGRNRTQPVTT